MDRFGIQEKEKLSLTLERLKDQQALEISQADQNAAKIAEVNAKYERLAREAKKASIQAELTDQLATLDAFGAISKAANEKVLVTDKSTFEERKTANANLLKEQLFIYKLEAGALREQLDEGLIAQHEYDLGVQTINNKRAAATIKSEEQTTADILREIAKRTSAIQGVFAVFQKGLAATMDVSGLTEGLTQLQNFGVAASEVFAKIKAGTITTQEGLKAIAVNAVAGIQSTINQIFADSTAERKQVLDEALTTLQQSKADELDNANLTEKQKYEINQRYAAKEREAKIAAFKADKEAKKEQAAINGMLAVTQAFATNPFPYSIFVAGIVAASVLAQVNKINNAKVPKYRQGKVDIEGPGTTTSDSIHAMISKGESVINAASTAKWKPALEAINNNKFEKYLQDKLSAFIYPQVPDSIKPVQSQIDYDKLSTAIAEKLSGVLPSPTQIHNVIDGEGLRSYVVNGNSRTEYKNKRYSI